MTATVIKRYPNAGFVYTNRTRMLFAPKHTSTRCVEDRSSPDLVMMTTARWPEPTELDVRHIRAALVQEYPRRRLFADTEEGLVQIYEPSNPEPDYEVAPEGIPVEAVAEAAHA